MSRVWPVLYLVMGKYTLYAYCVGTIVCIMSSQLFQFGCGYGV